MTKDTKDRLINFTFLVGVVAISYIGGCVATYLGILWYGL